VKRGFTLIELLIVIAVAGVLLSIAIPNFFKWWNSFKVKDVAEQIASDLELARAYAFERGSSKILFDTRNNTYSLFSPSDSTSPVYVRTIPPKFKLETNFGNEMEFRSNKLPDRSGSINVSYGNIIYQIVISNLTGRIMIKRVK